MSQTSGASRTNQRHYSPQSSPPRHRSGSLGRSHMEPDSNMMSAEHQRTTNSPHTVKQELTGRAGYMAVPHIGMY